MSLHGTNAKCHPHRGMSEFGGEAENICSHRVFRILTLSRRCSEQIYEAGRTGPLCEASSDRSSTIASQAIVARCCSRTSHYTIVQRYTRERISYWLCRPVVLELRRSQDGRNAVCLRRAEG